MNLNLEPSNDAFQLNNLAVRHMAASESKVALKALTQSLGMINNFLVDALTDPTSGYPAFDVDTKLVPGLDNSGTFYVYDHAFVLSVSCQTVSLGASTAIVSALVLFNLALGFHQQGTVMNHRRSIEKALVLYNQCSAILELPEALLADHTLSPIVGFLRLATTNNQAAILYEQGDREASSELLELIGRLYSQMPQPEPEGIIPISNPAQALVASQEPYMQEILLNAAILSTPPTTAPSA